MPETYSIRESLQGALQDYIRKSGFECVHLEAMIREVVGLLASYREENTPLFPPVYVFAAPNGLRALSPADFQITMGRAPLAAKSAPTIIKNCAPLAVRGWAIFVVKENDQIRYGLFRSMRHSLATGAEESMRDLGKEVPIILIRNRGHLVVELSSTIDLNFTAALTTDVAQPSQLEKDVGKFVDVAASAVNESGAFKAYFKRLLTTLLQDGHGTLLSVIEHHAAAPKPPGLEDGIWLDPCLPLAELHARAAANSVAETLADLQAAEGLLAGMTNSDGVIVLGTDGSILAYRVFLKANDGEKVKIPEQGGGRRRTFELMKIRLETDLRAAFFRSQDGDTGCRRSGE